MLNYVYYSKISKETQQERSKW